MNKKKLIPILILLLLLLIGICIYLRQTHETPSLNTDDNAVDWNGNQDLNHRPTDIPKIAIPGITSLVFSADDTIQKVNFYNPEENSCLFLMSLYADNKCYWESGYIEAGKGYYEIELSEPIPQGEYPAYLMVRCFKESGMELNSARVEFNLSVE